MDTENNVEIQNPVPAVKQKSQRNLVYELIQAVLNGKTREEGTHMRDFLSKDEKKVVKTGIADLIKAGAMRYKKDPTDEAKVRRYASCLLCDVFKRDSRYS